MNTFLKNNPVCGEYIQKILHQETMLFPHFSDEHPQILNCISVLFDAMYEKDTGYELTVFGQFYHFFLVWFSVIITLSKILPERAETINVFYS